MKTLFITAATINISLASRCFTKSKDSFGADIGININNALALNNVQFGITKLHRVSMVKVCYDSKSLQNGQSYLLGVQFTLSKPLNNSEWKD